MASGCKLRLLTNQNNDMRIDTAIVQPELRDTVKIFDLVTIFRVARRQ